MRETSLSLLERLQRRDGDEAAWQEFIGRYAGLLRIWCTGWGVASADIDDVIQDTLVQVLSSLPGFQRLGRGSFRGWMKTIARRCWLQMIKRFDERKRPAQLTQELASQLACEELTSAFDREAQRELIEMAMSLVRQRVKRSTWEAFSLTALEEIPAAEVAALLGMQTSAVYMARCRVQRLVAEELRGLDPDDLPPA